MADNNDRVPLIIQWWDDVKILDLLNRFRSYSRCAETEKEALADAVRVLALAQGRSGEYNLIIVSGDTRDGVIDRMAYDIRHYLGRSVASGATFKNAVEKALSHLENDIDSRIKEPDADVVLIKDRQGDTYERQGSSWLPTAPGSMPVDYATIYRQGKPLIHYTGKVVE